MGYKKGTTNPLDAKKRKDIARYMAFSGQNTYDDISDYSVSIGGLMKHVEECTRYYLEKKWMYGSPLKNNGYYRNDTCDLNPLYQGMIIAHTPMEMVVPIFIKAKAIFKKHHYYMSSYDENHETLAKALNIYCRAYPETLDFFNEKDDFAEDKPSAEASLLAQSRWKLIKDDLSKCVLGSNDIRMVTPFLMVPAFKNFIIALPEDAALNLINEKAYRYWEMKFLKPEEYDYIIDILQARYARTHSSVYLGIFDSMLFYQHFLLYGDMECHLKQMNDGSCAKATLSAIKALQENRANDALKELDTYLKANSLTIFDTPIQKFIYGLALLMSDTPASLRKAEALQKRKMIKDNQMIPYFKLLLRMKTNPETDFPTWIKNNNIDCYGTTSLGAAFLSLLCVHYGYGKTYNDTAAKYGGIFINEGIKVLALDFAEDIEAYNKFAETLKKDTGMQPLLPPVKKLEQWEVIIDSMMMKFGVGTKASTKSTSKVTEELSRVSYLINDITYDVQPRLQKSKNGGRTWSSGRNIALSKFQKGIPEMTAADSKVAMMIDTYSYGWYGNTALELRGAKVIEALVGHPLVFDEKNPDLKIEIQQEKLQIQVKSITGGYTVSHNVDANDGVYDTINIRRENAQLIKVTRLSTEEKEILTLLDRVKVFPKASKEKLTQLLAALGKKVTVMSPLLKDAGSVKQKKGNTKLTVQLVPYGEVFTVRCFVKPLTSCPPYCTPGKGLEYIAANVKGEMVQVARNLSAEKKNAQDFDEWMTPFDDYQEEDGWELPIESCLEVLDTLRQHQDICTIEWPEGIKFCVSKPALNSGSLSLSVKGMGHWFEVDGEVQIDEKQKMKVSELLKRVREAKGRFIQIGDAEYIALSQQLQKQLAALDRVIQTDHRQLKIASFNSSFLQDLADSGADVKADRKYSEMMKRLEEADTMKFSIPKTLQADLRDYQKDGYRWLCRLAHWGSGACLADDMGLGKTIQTIALLLARAKEGASLVVMPTSVLINWRNELKRFAPSLNPVILRDVTDRKEAVGKAGNQDVVLITYGLLPTEDETLTAKKWNVIVLDEAHSIKNKETKTSKAAMQLDGQFRLLLTGTPLQNHLSEIWNLFQFATPGLLTGYTQFTEKFITPIEKNHDKEPQRLLKRMLQPFILRRTKTEVLDELPEKTEITLKVELSEAERALYDRFREEAVLNLEDGGQQSAIKALAELTRLRQTVCNAALVLPAKEAKVIPSSKMEAFLKLVDELTRNHHRALVFSQFTSHLALVQKELKKLNIGYEYLDGSVTPADRIKRVTEFQNGDMPLFLISLKAGGTGLNLTAADYVIHLDPWWNPAIEDQASDRAYRIGQDKPVTVYRLIAENTIEEKIIALHQTKKSLADALLEGSDMAYALGKDEILSLIRGVE